MAHDQKYYGNQAGQFQAGAVYGNQATAADFPNTTAGPAPDTFMGPLARAEDSLNDLLGRVQRLTDRMVGPVPTGADSKPSLDTVSNGMFDDIARIGMRMGNKLSNAHSMLERIENQLP